MEVEEDMDMFFADLDAIVEQHQHSKQVGHNLSVNPSPPAAAAPACAPAAQPAPQPPHQYRSTLQPLNVPRPHHHHQPPQHTLVTSSVTLQAGHPYASANSTAQQGHSTAQQSISHNAAANPSRPFPVAQLPATQSYQQHLNGRPQPHPQQHLQQQQQQQQQEQWQPHQQKPQGVTSSFPQGHVSALAESALRSVGITSDLLAEAPGRPADSGVCAAAGLAANSGQRPADPAAAEQLRMELQQLQERLGEAEGTTAVLRSKVQRLEREKTELSAKAAQAQVASQAAAPAAACSGLAAFNVAELQRQLTTAQQQMAFQEQEMADLKRMESERTERLRQAETRAKLLEQENAKAQQAAEQLAMELEEANRERRERAHGASTSNVARMDDGLLDAALNGAGPMSPVGSLLRRSSARQKRRLSSPTGPLRLVSISKSHPASQPQPGSAAAIAAPASHAAQPAVEPPQQSSVAGAIMPSVAADPRLASAVALPTALVADGSAAGAASTHTSGRFGEALLPAASALHWGSLLSAGGPGGTDGPMAGRQRAGLLQQLWGGCGASLAMLTSLAGLEVPQPGDSQTPSKALWRAPALQMHAGGQATAAGLTGARTGLKQGFATALQRHLQLLATCGSGAAVLLLADICSFLVASHQRHVNALPDPAPAGFLAPSAAPGSTDSATRDAELGGLREAALRVVAEVIAREPSCAVAALRSCGIGLQEPDNACGVASGRICIDGSANSSAGNGWLAAAAGWPSTQGSSCSASLDGLKFGGEAGHGSGVLAMLLQCVLHGSCAAELMAAAEALVVLLAAAPVGNGRAAMAPILTTGALERLPLSSPRQRLVFAWLLRLLLAEAELVTLLQSSLDSLAGGSPQRSQRQSLQKAPASQMATAAGSTSAFSGWAVSAGLQSCLTLDSPSDALKTSNEETDASASAAAAASVEAALPGAEHSSVPCSPCGPIRAALAVVSALLEQRQCALLALLMVGGSGGGGGLAQTLIGLADACTGRSLGFGSSADESGRDPAAAGGNWEAAGRWTWRRRVRCAAEALTLLKALLSDATVGPAALEDLTATPASLRHCRLTISRLLQGTLPAAAVGDFMSLTDPLLPPLPLAAWAVALGSSSSARSSGGARSAPPREASVEGLRALARSLRQRLIR